MTNPSTITTFSDSAGDYEQEVFDCSNPKAIIIGVHGNGVRRWDGEKFYYQVSEHFQNCAIYLIDQNQPEKDGCRLNSLFVMVSRVQKAVSSAKTQHPQVPIWVIAHSMGCGVAALLDTAGISGFIFVAPAVGAQTEKYIKRYGPDIINGKVVKTTEGFYKNISKEFMDSVANIKWQKTYSELLSRFPAVHVFESGADEIVDEERFELREMPFASYQIIEDAPHNFHSKYSTELFRKIDSLLD